VFPEHHLILLYVVLKFAVNLVRQKKIVKMASSLPQRENFVVRGMMMERGQVFLQQPQNIFSKLVVVK